MAAHMVCRRCAVRAIAPGPSNIVFSPMLGKARYGNNGLFSVAYFTSSARFASPNHPSEKNRRQKSSVSSSSVPEDTSATSSLQTSAVNPPTSTWPAPVDVPQRSPTDGQLKYYWSVGRAYLSFYKTGVKNVYHNYRASLPFRRQLNLPAYLPTSAPPASFSLASSDPAQISRYLDSVSRSEFQLVRRSAFDVRRMIPFSLILFICAELTPLVILFIGNHVTPKTCQIPKQVDQARMKKLRLKQAALRGLSTDPQDPGNKLLNSIKLPDDVDVAVKEAKSEDILRACAAMGLSGRLTFPAPLQGILTETVYRPKLLRWLRYLKLDDWLLIKGGGVRDMSTEEVKLAVEERGGVDVGLGLAEDEAEKEQRKWLGRWLKNST